MNSDKKGRAFWHDYKAKCIYFITMKKAVEAPAFGKIAGNPVLPFGTPGCAFISLSPLGRIVKNAIYNISRIEPRIRLFQYAVMPDHVHFLLSVEQNLDEPLGLVIARLKASINNTAGRDFHLCEAGRLLIISIRTGGDLSRSVCLALNALALTIAKEKF